MSNELAPQFWCISINQLVIQPWQDDTYPCFSAYCGNCFLHMTNSSKQPCTQVYALMNENREVPDWTGLNYSSLETLPVPAPLLLSSIISCWFGDSDSVYKHESVRGLSQPLPHTDKNREWTVGGTARGNAAALERLKLCSSSLLMYILGTTYYKQKRMSNILEEVMLIV